MHTGLIMNGEFSMIPKSAGRPELRRRTPREFFSTLPGCNPEWVAEPNGTGIIMLQGNYGKYIRDDGDSLLRLYIQTKNRKQFETFSVGQYN
jgi:hypothetical protein